MPALENGTHLYRSQSITMRGNGILKVPVTSVSQVRISATFDQTLENEGFDSSFFNFEQLTETILLNSNSYVQFYVGNVLVTIGQV